MNQSVKIVAAAAGGYVLGRRKKFKMAIALGLYVAGKQLKLDPQKIAGLLMKRLGDSPQFAELRDQAQGQLVTVGKAAASAIVDRQAGRVADALQARTERLTGGAEEEEEEEPAEAEDQAEEQSEDEGEEPAEEQAQDEETSGSRSKSGSRSGGSGKRRAPTRRSGSGTSRRRSTAGSEA